MKVNKKTVGIIGAIGAVVATAVIVKKVHDDKQRKEVENIGVEEEETEQKETIVDKATNYIVEHQNEIAAATQVLGLGVTVLSAVQTVKAIKGQKQTDAYQKELMTKVKSIESYMDSWTPAIEASTTFAQASMPTAPRVAMEEYFQNNTGDYAQYYDVLARINRGEIR